MTIAIDTLVVGPIDTNCYIVSSLDETLVIDPGDDFDRIHARLGDRKVKYIVITHRHWDHIGAVAQLVELTGAPVLCHEADAHAVCHPDENGGALMGSSNAVPKVDRYLYDEDVLDVGDLHFTVLHTPGHTVGGICLYEPDEKLLFSGDTLFAGTVGRTDFETGSLSDMKGSCVRLGQLPDDVRVYPGHGDTTTIGREKAVNALLR